MEAVGSFFDEEWESLNRMFSTESADFMLQLHGDDPGLFSTNDDGSDLISSAFWQADNKNVTISGIDESIFSPPFRTLNTNLQYLSQECSINSTSGSDLDIFFPNNGGLQPNNEYVNNLLQVANNNAYESIDIYVTGHENSKNNVMEDMPCSKEEMRNQPTRDPDVSGKEMQLKRKIDKLENQQGAEKQKSKDSTENPKKRSRVSRNGPQNKKKAQPKAKKNQKSIIPVENEGEGEGVEEMINPAGQNIQSSSCSASSENDSNASQELNGDSKESVKEKTRAGREAATDPQSLYARKRRERINERLKMLQNLVPNGTKVDISTMLEEAVHYVKFLQLQIKLLSSDELWMYAPIAYNGMDIGFYQKILPNF